MHWIGLLVQTVIHMAKVIGNFPLQSTPWENAILKCSKISTLKNRQMKMQLKL